VPKLDRGALGPVELVDKPSPICAHSIE